MDIIRLRLPRGRGGADIIYSSRRRAFTMIELIMVVAILATLAAIISPRISWMEPPQRIIQRTLIEAAELAKSGLSVRFRVDKEENEGAIIPEVLVRENEEEREVGEKVEGTWKPLLMQWAPAGTKWKFDPEMIYFFQDGTCTPAKVSWGESPSAENYLLTVTGYLVKLNELQ